MFADVACRLAFFTYRGDRSKMFVHLFQYGFMWENWVENVGSYDSPEPEYHAVLIGPEWTGEVDLARL